MQIAQKRWTPTVGWEHLTNNECSAVNKPLVFVFGNRFLLAEPNRFAEIQQFYPDSPIIINSTAGEIVGTSVQDESIVTTAISFDAVTYQLAQVNSADLPNSYEAGKTLATRLYKQDLRHIFVISDGQSVNGSELAKGFNENLPDAVSTTGGLAGDDTRFEQTLVGLNKLPSNGNIIAIGFYGEALQIGCSSAGGWTPFGPERVVTKSNGNILYELDGKSALGLYKRYLGDKADGLPSTGLLFPLSIKLHKNAKPLVRTILGIDEANQSMIFAGDIPEGSTARLMKANFDKLIDGAFEAADASLPPFQKQNPTLALLVSCVGRKLVLDQRIEEEVESVREVVGDNAFITGFYSYGEIAPFAGERNCELHNQTMTVTLIGEAG